MPSQASGFTDQALEALNEELRLAELLPGLGHLLAHAQIGPRIFEKPLAPFPARLLPGAVDDLDLGARQLLAHDRAGHLLTGISIEARQRDERFHRRLGRDPAPADRRLNAQRKLAHQPQTS